VDHRQQSTTIQVGISIFRYYKEESLDPFYFIFSISSSVRIEGNVLRFTAITQAAAGDYRCTANNEYGTRSESARVTVKKPGVFQTVPPVPGSQVQQRRVGETIQLRCSLTNQYGGDHRGNIQVSGELTIHLV